jgi:diguanylate cyclase (GGDEF)-like protein
MAKSLKKIISTGEILAIVIIILGLGIAIFLDVTAFRIIGVSIVILGAVALFISISQKLSDVVETNFTSPKRKEISPDKEFTITEKVDDSGKRQTVEDFRDSFGPDMYSSREEDSHGEDFDSPEDNENETGSESPGATPVSAPKPPEIEFSDGVSSIRIRKIKKLNIAKTADIAETIKEEIKTEEKQENSNTVNTAEVKDIEQDEESKDDTKITNNEDVPGESDSTGEKPINESLFDENSDDDEESGEEDLEEKISDRLDFISKKINVPLSHIMDKDIVIGDEPRKEFEYFLSRVLMIIRSITDTRTAVFMLVNPDRKEMILESFVTNKPEFIKRRATYPIGNDIISQIILGAKPEILSEINPSAELDLVPYYRENASTGSFIGVPVFFNEAVIGVLCADSESQDAYGSVTVAFLGHFTKLISALVQSYTKKFNLTKSHKTLEALNLFNMIASDKENQLNITDVIIETLGSVYENCNIGLVGFNDESGKWEVRGARHKNFDYEGKEINIDKSVIGRVIAECSPALIEMSETGNLSRICREEPEIDGSNFAAAPIFSESGVYGAVYVESTKLNNLSEFDVNLLYLLGEQAGKSIEKMQLQAMFNESALVDPETGLLNSRAFYIRLSEETQRSDDFNSELTLCLFKIDKYAAIEPEAHPERYSHALYHSINIIRKYLNKYDAIGRTDEETIGVLLIGRNAEKSKLWAEKIRGEIANTVINLDGTKLNVTISAGLNKYRENDDISSLYNNAYMVLNKSSEKNNTVTSYN